MRTEILPNSAAIMRQRVLSGLNKTDLARAAGIPHSSVIRAEDGKSVSPKTATGICRALGMEFDALFTIKAPHVSGSDT